MTVFCPKCNSRNNNPKYANDHFYVCSDCGHIIGYECHDRFYDYNHLAFLNNAFVCKECGKIQWGYTEYKKKGRDC